MRQSHVDARRSRAKESVAIAPRITLEIRYPDRSPITRTFGPGRMVIGRETGDIILGDKESSALHAELEFTQGRVIVRDLGSRNGTLREGKRLPQFALLAGQGFRCGTTDVVLLRVEGAGQAPEAGGTAAGSEQVDEVLGQSSATLEGMPPPGAVGESSTTLPDSALPTIPGQGSGTGPRTVLAPGGSPPPGAPPPPQLTPETDVDIDEPDPRVNAPTFHPPTTVPAATPSPVVSRVQVASLTIPAGMSVPPELGQPAPVSDGASADSMPSGVRPAAPASEATPPVVRSGATQTAAPQPQLGPPMAAPAAATGPTPGSKRGPVANAVLKPGEIDLGPNRRKASGAGRGLGRVVKWVGASVVGLGALGGIAFLIYSLVIARNQAFFGMVAAELPEDTIGVIAAKSPKVMLELLGEDFPAELSKLAEADLGFDPFNTASYTQMGVDVEAPVAVALLSSEGTFSLSFGVRDREAVKESLSQRAKEALHLEEDLRWIERGYEDVPGMWLDEPVPVAVLWPDSRAIIVAGGHPDDVTRLAKAIAKANKGENLSTRPGFQGIVKQRGKTLAAAYVDAASARAALQRPGLAELQLMMALSDVDGVAFALVDDGPRIDLVWQTIIRDGAELLTVFGGNNRQSTVQSSIPTPVLVAVDGKIDASVLYRAITATAVGPGLKLFDSQFKEETGLDLRADILDNVTGAAGFALLNLQAEANADDWAAMSWVQLVDESKAKSAAERFFATHQSEITLEQIAGTTVYTTEGFLSVKFFVHGGHLFVAMGNPDIEAIIKGPSASLATNARIPEISDAMAKGGLSAGFVDVRQLLFAIRPLLSDSEREQEKKLAPLVSPMEVVTLRTELKKRSIVSRLTLHTSWEHALPSMVQAAAAIAGPAVAQDIEEARRSEQCDELIDHLLGLMRAELGEEAVADIEDETRTGMLSECESDETTLAEIQCMQKATSLDQLSDCEKTANTQSEDVHAELAPEGDPKPVPFIDDIWPNTKATGAGSGKPDPSVNYAVGLGTDPQVRGPANALVTIVMFGDFQCPYCKRSLGTLDEVMAKHGKDVRLVFRHNPLPGHGQAREAAKAALAAAKQDKFWPFHDKMFDNQSTLLEVNFVAWATALSLEVPRFERDLADRLSDTQIDEDIAAAASFGANFTPSFFVNGRFLSGAQPLHKFEALIEQERTRAKTFVERRGNTRKGLYKDMISHFAPGVTKPPTAPVGTLAAGKRYSVETTDLPRKGTSGIARVEIVECSDFDCPFCERVNPTMDKIVKDYSSSVALFWLHNPLASHPGAEPAARAATAAGNQGKFWEMHARLFANTSLRSKSDFDTMARDLGLDMAEFSRDYAATETKELVVTQQKVCTDNDARGTPAFFINGRLVSGAQPYDRFKEVIDEELSGGI